MLFRSNGTWRGKTRDGMLLAHYYPKMWTWVSANANGRRMALPEDGGQPEPILVPARIHGYIMSALMSRNSKISPLSHKAQTKSQGRYIVDLVAQECGIPELEAKSYIKTLLDDGEIEFVMFDKHKRISGLRIVEESNG